MRRSLRQQTQPAPPGEPIRPSFSTHVSQPHDRHCQPQSSHPYAHSVSCSKALPRTNFRYTISRESWCIPTQFRRSRLVPVYPFRVPLFLFRVPQRSGTTINPQNRRSNAPRRRPGAGMFIRGLRHRPPPIRGQVSPGFARKALRRSRSTIRAMLDKWPIAA